MRCQIRVTRCHIVSGVTAAVVIASVPAAGRDAEFGLAGGEETVWAYLIRAEPPDNAKLVHFAFMPLGEHGGRFLPLQQDETGGAPLRTAVRRTQLHVFFQDGTHLSYAPVARSITPKKSTFCELKLPDSCVPLALAGDGSGDALYAVVPRPIAWSLEREPAPQSSTSATEPATRPAGDALSGLQMRAAADDTPVPLSNPRTGPVPARYCLVRYVRGVWHRDRAIPSFFDDQTGCLLAAADGVCDLYFTRSGDEPATYFAHVEDNEWSAVERVIPAPFNGLLACNIADGQPVAVVNHGDRVALVVRRDGEWEETARIDNPSLGGWATSERSLAACASGSTVVLALPQAEGGIRAGVWDMSGTVAVEPATLEALAPRPEAPVSQRTFRVLPYVVLTLILLSVFIRRRRSVRAACLPPDLVPASHGRRLLAFVLDALITAPAIVMIMSGWLKYVEQSDAFEANLKTALADYPWELNWRWLVALAVYIAYCALFEAFRGATPGKLLSGCRVVSEDGERCGLGAIVVRNVLRCVEFAPGFTFAPMLILVFLTRNRQRLGDMVARSVVVEVPRTEPRL